MTFRVALSGLNAASQDLKVTGNNVANASTTGFKGSRPEFVDVFATTQGSVSSTAIGGGVRLASVRQQFSQGNINFTQNNLDLAINGQGFFVLDDNGSNVYSRSGAFTVDRDGYVVNQGGQRLQAFPANSGGGFNTGALQDLQLTTGVSSPQATSSADVSLNLKSDGTVFSSGSFDATDPDTYNYSTSMTMYDSLGESHTGTFYFRRTSTTDWSAYLHVDGTATSSSPQTLTFNSSGALTTGPSFDFGTFSPSNGASAMSLSDIDFGDTTQFGAPYSVSNLSQNGYTTGRLSGIDVDDKGVISARFTNGQSDQLGKVALASFPNQQGLRQLGETTWADSFSAGDRQLGEAGTSSFGLIQSGALEASNVDIAEQLVNLITAQRNFQANSQVISTADTITQSIINIRR